MGEEDDDQIEISKELFLTVVQDILSVCLQCLAVFGYARLGFQIAQDRHVQRLMDDLDLPPDRANLFEALDADGSGTLHVAELVQGLLKVRGDLKKTDTVATLLATRAVFRMLERLSKDLEELRQDTATLVGRNMIARPRRQSIFDF